MNEMNEQKHDEQQVERYESAIPLTVHPIRRHPWVRLDASATAATAASDTTAATAATHAAASHGITARHSKDGKDSNGKTAKKRTASAPAEHLLTERDDAILRALSTFHFLSADQGRRLCGYSHGSLDAVRKHLKHLTEGPFVLRMRLPRASAGNAPWVYGLDRLGLAYLAADTGSSDDPATVGRFRASEQHERSYLFLTHTLAVNDFLIAAALLEHQAPEIVLAGMRHERTLKRRPIRVATAPDEWQVVIPDGWLDFHIRGTARLCIVLELDRATEQERAFKRKLHGLLAYASGPYQEAFGTDSLAVAIATTGGPRRLEYLRKWCEQVLRTGQREQEEDLFFLTELPPGEPDPRTMFLAPVWIRPFATDRIPLIEL